MESRFSEQTYAERVTNIYKKVSKMFGPDNADTFNEYVRGASLLDGSDKKVLSEIEGLDDKTLEDYVKSMDSFAKGLMFRFKTKSLYEAFQKIEEAGRSTINVWGNGEYETVEPSKKAKEVLPWAGQIYVGGPKHGMVDSVFVVNTHNVVTPSKIIINEISLGQEIHPGQ